ncbi:MAG: DUF3343 domain-containing protein [Oscillospiraceae bacterium]
MQYYLKCRSMTQAQRGAKVLEHSGVTGTVTRLPKSVSDRGCGYSIIVSPRNLDRALGILASANLRPDRIYVSENDGSIREAAYDIP